MKWGGILLGLAKLKSHSISTTKIVGVQEPIVSTIFGIIFLSFLSGSHTFLPEGVVLNFAWAPI